MIARGARQIIQINEMGQVGLAHGNVHVPSKGQALLRATRLPPGECSDGRASKSSRENTKPDVLDAGS